MVLAASHLTAQGEQTSSSEHVDASVAVEKRLVIVGGGMSGYGLCDRLVRLGVADDYRITIIGDEPVPAYDRVNLSSYFSGRTLDDLVLASRHWYQNNGIDLQTGRRVCEIDRSAMFVVDDHGDRYAYDHLVLATGSHAFVPPIEGSDSEGVFVYRTIDDLRAIREHCRSTKASRGAVIGGGLLGLEAAQVLMDLGLAVDVVEMAPGLMPRQLDAEESKVLEDGIREMGVSVHLVRRTKAIVSFPAGRMRLEFENAEALSVDLLIIAAGVRPNDQLARQSGLETGERYGIVVDSELRTSDPNISAIGECVSFQDHVFGLVAPCYRMADVLAGRLGGSSETFEGADESAELKLLGIQVATLGKSIGESPGGRLLKYRSGSGYRTLLVERGRVAGASCVGDWEELAQVRQAIAKRSRLWPWQRKRFINTGSPWTPGGALPVTQWPADATICSCLSLSKQSIVEIIDAGVCDVEVIGKRCGAGTACGSCRGLVAELAGRSDEVNRVPGATVMLAASTIASLIVILWWVLPAIPIASSVQDSWYSIDRAIRSDVGRQVSGFSLVALTLIGLIFSLRKRNDWFRFGSYGFWRATHGVLGTAVLIGMVIHTGLKLGSNLNFLLGVCFLAATFIGAIAGIVSSIEGRATGSLALLIRRWRPRLTRTHLWVTWPLPVLIVMHILSFYWFSD
ncbi:MAG: FAD-dependent oxidoreductase [Planctomycetota bacterium]